MYMYRLNIRIPETISEGISNELIPFVSKANFACKHAEVLSMFDAWTTANNNTNITAVFNIVFTHYNILTLSAANFSHLQQYNITI